MKLILGSKSRWRQQILHDAGYQFEIMTADIDEKAIRSDDLEQLPLLVARAKAQALLPKITQPAILITSDEIIVCNGELREKPIDENEARAFLQSYNHYPAQAHTSVVVINTQTGQTAEIVEIAKIYFKNIPDANIEQLIKEGNIFNESGAFAIEDPLLSPYIDHIEGDPTTISGLPLKATEALIKQVSN